MRRSISNVRLGLGMVVATVLLMVLCFAGVLYALVHPKPDQRTVRAVFTNTQQLRAGDKVRIAGIDAGEVQRIALAPDRRTSIVTMRVDESAGPLYKDATADIHWRLLLGANFSVRLSRGTPAAGALGTHLIPARRTGGQVELEDVTSIDRGAAEKGLQTLPGELAKTFRGRDVVGPALRSLADASPALAQGLRGLRGQQPDSDLRRLVAQTAATARAIAAPPEDLRRLVAGAAATLQTTAARAADLRATLTQAPGVMQRTDATLRQLDHTLALADPVIGRLQGPAPDVAPTLARLRPTVVDADRLLLDARPLLHSLRPAVTSLASTAKRGRPLVDSLLPSLNRLDDVILPYLDEVDPQTKHTTAQMIGPTIGGLGPGAAGQQDENGHFIRFPATSGSNPLLLPCQIFAGDPDKTKLVECQTLQEAAKTLFSYRPLGPAPGTSEEDGG